MSEECNFKIMCSLNALWVMAGGCFIDDGDQVFFFVLVFFFFYLVRGEGDPARHIIADTSARSVSYCLRLFHWAVIEWGQLERIHAVWLSSIIISRWPGI